MDSVYLQKGRAYYIKKDYTNAIRALSNSINKGAYLAQAFALRGEAYRLMNKPETDKQAVQDYNRAL